MLGADDEEQSTRLLLQRYLEAFGPATAQDFGQFTMLRQPVIQKALKGLAGTVEPVAGPGSAKLFDLAGAPIPDDDTPAPPRLLGMWDNILLAYADRGRVIPEQYRAAVIRRNGDTLPTLLVDGYVAGVWRPVDGGIEATAFRRLDARTWSALAAEAAALAAFLARRDPDAYRRYAHWWDKEGLPGAEVRILPG
jgi:hypothetical protein